MKFPFPNGGSSWEEKDRYERATLAINRLTGEGGFTDEQGSLFRRTLQVFSQLCAGVSLSTSRLLEQVFANSAHKEDCLERHEQHLRVVRNALDGVEERWAALERVCADRAGSRIWDVKARLELLLGAGTVTPKFNIAADLDAAGHSRVFMFAIAYEVPVALIATLGQVRALDERIKRYKAITCEAVVTREVARGFLTDDDLSLTDRDVLDG